MPFNKLPGFEHDQNSGAHLAVPIIELALFEDLYECYSSLRGTVFPNFENRYFAHPIIHRYS